MLHPRKDYARIQDPAGLIPENEPVFLLRAQDSAADITVHYWAETNKQLGGDPKLSEIAHDWADKMEAWSVKKLADLPAELPVELPDEKPNETELGERLEQPTKEDEQKWEEDQKNQLRKLESKPEAGIISEPEKSQNRDDSGVS